MVMVIRGEGWRAGAAKWYGNGNEIPWYYHGLPCLNHGITITIPDFDYH